MQKESYCDYMTDIYESLVRQALTVSLHNLLNAVTIFSSLFDTFI